MNRVSLVGRLTRKPELRYTQSNLAYARFTIAVNRLRREDGSQDADFINCVAWNKQAENLAKYMDKGNLISVDGRIQTGTYDKSDGSKGYTTDVYAQSIQFLETKRDSRPEPVYPGQVTSQDIEVQQDIYSDFGDTVSLDDDFLD